MLALVLEEVVVSRGWRVSDAAALSSARGCGDGRSGAAAAGRSLLDVSALLSISAEKLSGAGAWSARADLDGVL